MSVFYKMSYRVGFHPWEDLAQHKPFSDALMELFEREERGKEPPYGKALDLGCGRATWGVPLTGVDNVPKAVARAQEHTREAGVGMRVVLGDVTHDLESAVGSGYDLVVDTGTFHGLAPEQRLAMGREVTAIASKHATVILDCFAPRNRGPLPRGCTQGDVMEAFPDWVITDIVDADTDPDPIAKVFKFDEVFYRLSRAQPQDR
jgi:hypothetical protein